jgi:vitamin B12 transporter
MTSSIMAPTRCGARRSHIVASAMLTSLLIPPWCTEAVAQQPASPDIVLPTIVVSPTGVPTPIAQVASSVTVITAADIEREQRRTVPDVLSTVPGLNVVQAGGPGAQTSVFIRGTNSNQVKVLIDGIDVSDPSNANRSFDFGQLLTADIERIEVLRGPQSGLYGADAIGGVISIITKKGEGPPKVTGLVEGGSFGTLNQSASLSGAQSRFNYAFNVAHFRTTDMPVTPPELLPPGRQAIDNWYDNWTYSTKLGADVSENLTFNYVARYTDAKLRFTGDEFDLATFKNVPAAQQSTQVVHQFFTRGEAVVSLFDDRLKNYFGVNYSNTWNWNKAPGPVLPNVNQGDRTRLDYRGVAFPVPGLTLVGGAEQETETLATASVSAENGNKAAYAEMQAENQGRIFLVANGRVDDNDSFGSHPTFRVAPAVIVPVTETKLKASFGTGFKAPTLTQLFVDFPEFNFFANPNLKPEESRGYDVGFEQPVFNDRVRFGATYFHNDITNLINVFFDPARFRSTLINVDEATTEGVEAFVSFIVSEQLKLRADYTYTNAVDARTDQQLLRRPRNKASVSAIWTPVERLTLTTTALFVGEWADVDRATLARVTQPGFAVVNVAANYVVNDQVTAFARIDNLFDERYQDPNGFLRPGFGIFGGVRLASR